MIGTSREGDRLDTRRLVHRDGHRDKPVVPLFRPLRDLIDFALPPRCPGCGLVVDDDDRFCVDCWRGLDFLTGAGCALCNTPVAIAGTICAPCLALPPRHDGVRAALRYGETARGVALGLKYSRRIEHARVMAHLMRRHVDDTGTLVPVPLDRWRLWSRGFNQAAVIAGQLATLTGVPVATELLVRSRRTTSQRGRSRTARADAVRGAFKAPRSIAGGTIWLVDDIYASGATANACAGALKRAGAERVVVLCWARVLRED